MRVERRVPINVSLQDRSLFEDLLVRKINDVFFYRLKNVSLLDKGFVFKNLTIFYDLLLSNDNNYLVPFNKRDLIRMYCFGKSINFSASRVLIINNIYSHTYYHWLLESLPRLFLLRDEISSATVLLPGNHNENFHKESLKIFGVDNLHYMKDDTRYVINEALTCSQIGKMANYHPLVLTNMVKFIKNKIPLLLNLGEKIYISRARALKRKVINDQEIESYLLTRGFVTLHFEDFCFADQVSLMHHCKFLISIHGAGLANMIFMTESSSVLELRKFDNGINYFYFTLANTVNLDYFYQFCTSPDANAQVQEANIIVDLDLLRKNVDKMLQR